MGETGAETIEKGLEMGRVTPPPGPLAYGYFGSSPLWELHSRPNNSWEDSLDLLLLLLIGPLSLLVMACLLNWTFEDSYSVEHRL